jgi:hypothetical protein
MGDLNHSNLGNIKQKSKSRTAKYPYEKQINLLVIVELMYPLIFI